jgi:NCS1 family nucleobase:cation symporter-1
VVWPAVICYLIGVAIQIPFMVIGTAYTGPIAKALGNTDISFVAGLLIVSPLYYFTVKALAHRRSAAAGKRIPVLVLESDTAA